MAHSTPTRNLTSSRVRCPARQHYRPSPVLPRHLSYSQSISSSQGYLLAVLVSIVRKAGRNRREFVLQRKRVSVLVFVLRCQLIGFIHEHSDAFFVVFYFVLFWFLRDASIRWVWEPLAGRFGITSKRAVARFAEQGWALLYFSVFWSIGMVSLPPSSFTLLTRIAAH